MGTLANTEDPDIMQHNIGDVGWVGGRAIFGSVSRTEVCGAWQLSGRVLDLSLIKDLQEELHCVFEQDIFASAYCRANQE